MVLVAGDPLRTNAYVFGPQRLSGLSGREKINCRKDWTATDQQVTG